MNNNDQERRMINQKDVDNAVQLLIDQGISGFFDNEEAFENDAIAECFKEAASKAVWKVITERLSEEDYEAFLYLISVEMMDSFDLDDETD